MKETYDVIVVGSGPGGLSAATSISQKGQKVLVIEKNGLPGGNCSAKKTGDYTFDLAVHQLSGVGEKGLSGAILRDYGIADKLNFKKIDPFLVLVLPDKEYQLPGSWDAYRQTLLKEFPDSEKDINRIMKKIMRAKRDLIIAQRILHGKNNVVNELMKRYIKLKDWLIFPFSIIKLWFEMNKTGDQVFRKYVKNEKLRFVLFSAWPYLGSPPKEMSGLIQLLLVASQHYDHTYYPVGSSQTVANAMVDSIKEHGGEVMLNTEVQKILVKDNRAIGVELPDGRQIKAKAIVANASMRLVYEKLIEKEHVPAKFMKSLSNLKVSLGPFKVLLGLDFDISKHGLDNHEYMYYSSYNHNEAYDSMSNGNPSVLSVYTPTKADPSLAPPGHSTVIMTMMVNWEAKRCWREHKEELAEEMIDMVANRVKGLRDHIVVKKIFTPDNLKNFSNSTDGSMYGWAVSTDQTLLNRMPQKSVIDNLFHVGHWTLPGPGVTTAIVSGWLLGNLMKKKYKWN